MSEIFKPSLIEPLVFSEFAKVSDIDILRDDLIHPLVAGNKWRKLKYIVEFILKNKKEKLVTFGGAYSNHLVATAFAGKHFGIKTFAFVRGDEKRPLNIYENKCLELGMELKHVSRSDYKNKEDLIQNQFSDLTSIEIVHEGGRHPLAFKGCQEIIHSLNKTYDFIVLSIGTGTTMEGLVQALSESKLPSKVIGISSLKGNTELDKILSPYDSQYWQIEHNYHRGKYAKKDVELESFIRKFKSETNIRLEFVYTGKMMMAVSDLIRNDVIKPHHSVLCIHTGGIDL